MFQVNALLKQALFSLKDISKKLKMLSAAIFMPRHKKWRGIMLYPPNF